MSDTISLERFFDQIYCINLESRPDRLAQFKENYAALGTAAISIVKAVNGKEIAAGDWEHGPGALGCRLSHLNIYKEALHSGYSRILVLEDDVVIGRKFRAQLTQLLDCTHDDWDMIYFGGYHHLKPDPFCGKFIRLNNTLSTHAIAINCRCLPALISKIESDARWIDSVIADLHPELKVFGFKKPIAWQRDGFSDITGTHINYRPGPYRQVLIAIKRVLKKVVKL
ncbi:glycosyltransferase family 25 protein [Mucilaginibacter calamicampi]|uniref:Glycosyltransferase family 25 protein n=1 Tax=Mucilaginibacter calamicampi TaxID=1302352 RepID=A0ABW2YSA5_9SPHI